MRAEHVELLDSRRLTGVNALWDAPGAVLELRLDPAAAPRLAERWQGRARAMAERLGWPEVRTAEQLHPVGVSLAIAAPIDVLYTATEVAEWALADVLAEYGGPKAEPFEAAAERLSAAAAEEASAPLLALAQAARERGKQFLWDDDWVSVGSGGGALTFPKAELPDADTIDWDAVHDVPVALVTGTNGKSTTVRLLAAMAARAGLTPGLSSTDWIRVGQRVLDRGDYSGPGGARQILRSPEVEVALLETARGGLVRRGLAVERAEVAAVLNIAADHLGEWGCWSLEDLLRAKLAVTRVVGPGGRVVLNADDALLVASAAGIAAPIVWFSLDAENPVLFEARRTGGEVAFERDGSLWLAEGPTERPVARLADIPITFAGAARHNTANALAALLIGQRLGWSDEALRLGLADFGRDPEDNPGRLASFDLDGVRVVVDFAHNPHGQEALLDMAACMDVKRRLVVLGQAGDRDDTSIDELVRVTLRYAPDRILIKEMERYLRGRQPGEVPARIEANLRAAGFPEAHFEHVPSESAALERALAWARPGDLVLLFAHAEREAVLERLTQLATPR